MRGTSDLTLAELRKKAGAPAAADVTAAAEHGPKHPSAWEYIRIGAVLAVITLGEVAIYYTGIAHNLLVTAIIVLGVLKFSLVVLWFMHLKFDNRLFSTLFLMGLVAALALFAVVVSTLGGGLV
jgi:cytochrome c oxidase subunit 4